jgi:hypothetical protein
MLWEIDLHPRAGLPDLDADGVADDVIALRLAQKVRVASSRGYLVQGPELSPERIERLARELFADTVAEEYRLGQVSDAKLAGAAPERGSRRRRRDAAGAGAAQAGRHGPGRAKRRGRGARLRLGRRRRADAPQVLDRRRQSPPRK